MQTNLRPPDQCCVEDPIIHFSGGSAQPSSDKIETSPSWFEVFNAPAEQCWFFYPKDGSKTFDVNMPHHTGWSSGFVAMSIRTQRMYKTLKERLYMTGTEQKNLAPRSGRDKIFQDNVDRGLSRLIVRDVAKLPSLRGKIVILSWFCFQPTV